MGDIEKHRLVVDQALRKHALEWDAWPMVAIDARLTADERLCAVLVLLATQDGDEPDADAPRSIIVVGYDEEVYDQLGRVRQPWQRLSRARLPWHAATATTAVEAVTRRRAYDERRISLALRGAKEVCAAGWADAALLEALWACLRRLDREGDEQFDVKPLRTLVRRVIASATPPQLLDLSLLADGDDWAGRAKEVARSLPPDEVTPLVRLLSDLGSRRPSQKWLAAVGSALEPASARRMLREWLEVAASTDIVPEWPGYRLDEVRGVLFVDTNADVVRAAAWATVALRGDSWPIGPLGALARRGSAHNGLPGFPEALALKAAGAAVDALIARGTDADRHELRELLEDLVRRDLRKRIEAALG